ncbi:MAG: YhgN family NAAT transporter [Gammaproteobacteria bacterium]|jgi:multiple antibiotic resistance protein
MRPCPSAESIVTTSDIISTTIIFFLIMDPLGNIPIFMSVLKTIEPQRRLKVTFRELLIAYVVLLIYLFFGAYILDVLSLSKEAISISGGIILFLIAIRMIFPTQHGIFGNATAHEPLIVPLAIPAVAGPSIMAVLMLMSTSQPTTPLLLSISVAWVITAAILLAATPLDRLLGERGLTAIERLMGMLLVMMSVQMMLDAWKSLST